MFETSVLFNNMREGDLSPKPEPIWSTARKIALPLLLSSGVVSVAWGTWLYYNTPRQELSSEVLFTVDTELSTDNILYVDISGAVVNPGIYPLTEGDRVASVVEAAGGLAAGADSKYVHSTLNLSARVKDEQKIYIPFEGERNTDTESPINITEQAANQIRDQSLISINTASAKELDTLPRIGAVTAQKIIDGRPYTTIEELVSKSVIGNAVLAEIQSLIKL